MKLSFICRSRLANDPLTHPAHLSFLQPGPYVPLTTKPSSSTYQHRPLVPRTNAANLSHLPSPGLVLTRPTCPTYQQGPLVPLTRPTCPTCQHGPVVPLTNTAHLSYLATRPTCATYSAYLSRLMTRPICPHHPGPFVPFTDESTFTNRVHYFPETPKSIIRLTMPAHLSYLPAQSVSPSHQPGASVSFTNAALPSQSSPFTNAALIWPICPVYQCGPCPANLSSLPMRPLPGPSLSFTNAALTRPICPVYQRGLYPAHLPRLPTWPLPGPPVLFTNAALTRPTCLVYQQSAVAMPVRNVKPVLSNPLVC